MSESGALDTNSGSEGVRLYQGGNVRDVRYLQRFHAEWRLCHTKIVCSMVAAQSAQSVSDNTNEHKHASETNNYAISEYRQTTRGLSAYSNTTFIFVQSTNHRAFTLQQRAGRLGPPRAEARS